MLYKVYKAWQAQRERVRNEWCEKQFIREQSMTEAERIVEQLTGIMRSRGYEITSCCPSLDSLDNCEPIQKALLAGFYRNLGTCMGLLELAGTFCFTLFTRISLSREFPVNIVLKGCLHKRFASLSRNDGINYGSLTNTGRKLSWAFDSRKRVGGPVAALL